MRSWWNSKPLAERRELVARRDQERIRRVELARGKTAAKQAAVRRSQQRHPERHAARRAVAEALRTGALIRQPCFCGTHRSEGHHRDYAKQLEVLWLCRRHHVAIHRKAA